MPSIRRLLPLLLLATVAAPLTGHASYAGHPEAAGFIQKMSERHGFDGNEVRAHLGRAERNDQVLRLIQPPASPQARSWQRYRGNFLTDTHIRGGVRFWERNATTIAAASERYQVPPEIIVAIIGVETNYGGYTGNFQTLSALATLAFDYPPRAELFRRELENLFLLAREQSRDPASYRGSYAGALGYPQFLPSSMRNYAVDFDDDGRIDFESDAVDAIGSVANYFAEHGWQPGEPVVARVLLPAGLDPEPLIAAGIEPALDPMEVMAQGITPLRGELHDSPVTLFDLPTPGQSSEYWVGYRNFYVITRYNRSSFYAMAVYDLSQAILTRRETN